MNGRCPQNLCKHFGLCGGCDYQDIPYDKQLKDKESRLKEFLSPLCIKEFRPIIPSPQICYYRNKMEYAVSGTEDIFIGLRQKRRFYSIVDIEECRIFYENVQNIFGIFKKWIRENNIEPYQLRRHSGNIRYAAVRHSKYYNEIMVTAVLASEEESVESLAEDLKNIGAVKSVYLCVNNAPADVAVTDQLRLLYGESHIRERINDTDYLIGANSFFQTNSYCCNKLYSVIKEEAASLGGNALDICCGSGGITLQVADNFDKITGVDNQAKNIEDARLNAGINKKGNAEFICDDAQTFLLNLKRTKNLSTIILDPPRAGLSKRMRQAVEESGVENIIYVSCNPVNLAEDLKTLTGAYKIEKMIPVDMFPHTRHVEVVAILKRDKV